MTRRGENFRSAFNPADEEYAFSFEVPTVADYCRLRSEAGLTPRSEAAAQWGLPGTVTAVVVRRAGVAIGMGRVVGDGLFYQIVDIAVQPDHQGRGLSKRIMSGLMDRLREIAPAEAYVSLIADGDAKHLYAQFGFEETAPTSVAMAQWIGREER